MIILLVLAAMLTIGIVLLVCSDNSTIGDVMGINLTVVGGLCLAATIALPIVRWDANSEIQQFKSVESSITQARTKLDIESAAIYVKIIDANKWLVGKKYWNKTLFDIWVPDEVEDLKPLK